jgi:hypothetical protein
MNDEKTADADGYEWRSGQEILFAVGLGGGRVLGYEGKNVYLAVTDEGMDGEPLWMDTDDIFFGMPGKPSIPGVYLFRGSIGIHFDDIIGTLDSTELKGEFSAATPEDIARLIGKHDPLTVEAEDRS